MLLYLLWILIVGACVGFIFREGLWSAFIRFVNVLMAGILATNFFEPVARVMEDTIGPKLTYFYDFLSFWLVFAVSMIVLHIATAFLSRVKTRFNLYLNQGGAVVIGLMTGVLMCWLFNFSLHLAPLGTKPFMSPVLSDDGTPLGIQWARVASYLSKGALSRPVSEAEAARYGGSVAAFPGAKNIFKTYYYERARKLEEQVSSGGGFTTESAPPR
ncbi:CvpA family protein [Thermogutta sp.]|uniref:CvpA family protein n=1 Tax=Thermogutta sp. TaxID=1962930 RepID=UPI0032208D07